MKINEKELKVRVDEDENQKSKRRYYWDAVDALRKFKQEDQDFFIVPRALGIYDAQSMDTLGVAHEGGYDWDAGRVAASLPGLNLVALRRATLIGKTQKS